MQIEHIYSIPVTPKKQGESPVYRHPDSKLELKIPLHNTMQKWWHATVQKFGKNKCLQNHTYNEVDLITSSIGSWLIQNKNKILYIHSKNRKEWVFADIACLKYGIITIPLYDTLGKQAIQHTIKLTQGHTILSTNDTLKNLINSHVLNGSNIQTVILVQDLNQDLAQKLKKYNLKTIKLQQIIQLKLNQQQPTISPQIPMTYSFTSGTTGLPKGVIITQSNFATQIYSTKDMTAFRETDIHLSYLPLAHMFERCMLYTTLLQGAQVEFLAGSIHQITKDLARVKPTLLPIVPRLLNRFYSILSLFTHVSKQVAEQAWKVKKQNWQKGILTSPYDDTVFKQAKQLFGGRLRFMATGSAPIAAQVLTFFRIVLGCDIRQGYGQTQTTTASFITAKGELKAGHVGGPNTALQFKLVDIPEMNYYSHNNPPTGEICMKGPTIFPGYFKDEKNTKQTIDSQGWHHSGDVGIIQANGALRLIDRKKNIFKLSQGEYIAPQKIENIYLRCPLVAEVFLYGDSLQSFNVAIIVPSKEAIQKIAHAKGITGTFQQLCKNLQIVEYVRESAAIVGKKQGLQGFEIAKKILLNPVSFLNYGLFTSTLKLQRYLAKKVFEKEIAELYSSEI